MQKVSGFIPLVTMFHIISPGYIFNLKIYSRLTVIYMVIRASIPTHRLPTNRLHFAYPYVEGQY